MGITYKWFGSWDEAAGLLKKMGKNVDGINWVESFAHLDEITIERNLFCLVPDKGYKEFFLLTMPHKNGELCNISDVRSIVYEEIRTAIAAGKF